MANPIIKIKRSAVPGKIPTTISLPTGEFAINTYDGKVYIQQEQVGIGSTVVAINPWSVGVGSNTYNTYFTAGNVGIGSTVPSSALTVQGDVSISGVVTATDAELYTNFVVTNSGASAYQFASTGIGFTQGTNNPTLYLIRGKKYQFSVSASGHPFWIKTAQTIGTSDQYNDGVTNNGVDSGTITFKVPFNAPSLLYYICQYHSGMNGKIYVIDAGIGPDVSVNTTGIITASSFVGNLTGNASSATYATSAGIATYATSAGIATYSTASGVSTSVSGGTASVTQLNVSGVSTFQDNVYLGPNDSMYFGTTNPLRIFNNGSSGNQIYSSGYRLYIDSLFNDISLRTGLNGTVDGIRVKDRAAVELYHNGNKKFETTGAGATVFGTLETQQLNVSGVVTATSFVGDGSNITGISTLNIVDYGVGLGGGGGGSGDSYWISNSAGIHTLSSVGIGTTNPNAVVTVDNTGVLAAGIVTAYKFYGDGSNITGISAVARVTVSQTAPPSPTEGDLWYHSTQARLFVYYTDTDSSQWIDAAPFNGGSGGSGASVSIGATAPTGPYAGDLWYNSDYGRLFIYYSDEDSQQWVDAAPFNFSGITTATYSENSFVATAGQTSFDVSYEVGYVDVFLNGIRLSSSEYTAVTGSSVVLDDPATEGDVVDIIEVATNIGPTGARGPAGETTLAGVTSTTDSTTYYPLFTAGIGSTVPYVSTESNYFGFIPSSGTLTVNQLNVGVTTLGVTTATNLTVQSINCSGVATALDFNSTSDINLKKDVKVIDNPVEKVSQLNGVSFNWTDTGQSSAGVIAQDVEKVMPEIIRNNPTGYKSLNYNGLIGLLIEAVKEQNETIKSLEQKINNLEERLN